MDFNLQGAYGEAYVQALAYAAGLTASKISPDIGGVDLNIGYPGEINEVDFPCIDAQVKTWTGGDPSADTWRYSRLTVTQFNKLAGGNSLVPRYLIVIRIPAGLPLAELQPDGLLLRHEARYADLSGEPKRDPNQTGTVPVLLPRDQILDIDSIRELVRPDRTVEAVT